ncbi:GntR family transcriptional regulator [Bacillus sp. S/N-304-OC-R1]|uniref:GntR family transcriptional regulator n=1 Tax=Bacillus sp. S/N-304-OC-R1 TaxID=2758034 RepID=UPI001C8E1202|nr:GntR family transcriptional regulator [Bacillus sp. S/N-304-OC-R1]MBY0123023.1 GntR family transcriptional regulator [Bacillus sp. S/N-304-OC-R1]
MIIRIEPQSEVPLYTQLTNVIIEGVARGYMHAGDSLPSVRSLAADLGVNMHTVNKSYHELEKKGIISIIPKSGAVINSPAEMNHFIDRLKDEFKPMIAEALALGLEMEQILELVTSLILDIKGKP